LRTRNALASINRIRTYKKSEYHMMKKELRYIRSLCARSVASIISNICSPLGKCRRERLIKKRPQRRVCNAQESACYIDFRSKFKPKPIRNCPKIVFAAADGRFIGNVQLASNLIFILSFILSLLFLRGDDIWTTGKWWSASLLQNTERE
jgi:hypothetical protein